MVLFQGTLFIEGGEKVLVQDTIGIMCNNRNYLQVVMFLGFMIFSGAYRVDYSCQEMIVYWDGVEDIISMLIDCFGLLGQDIFFRVL